MLKPVEFSHAAFRITDVASCAERFGVRATANVIFRFTEPVAVPAVEKPMSSSVALGAWRWHPACG